MNEWYNGEGDRMNNIYERLNQFYGLILLIKSGRISYNRIKIYHDGFLCDVINWFLYNL